MHTRPRVQRAPGLPCALLFWGANEIVRLGQNHVARTRTHVPSSPRTRGPITPGVDCCERRLAHGRSESPRRMGPRVRGDDEEPPCETTTPHPPTTAPHCLRPLLY